MCGESLEKKRAEDRKMWGEVHTFQNKIKIISTNKLSILFVSTLVISYFVNLKF